MAKRKRSVDLAEFKEIIQVPLSDTMTNAVGTLIIKPAEVAKQFTELPTFGLVVSLSPNPLGGYSVSVRQADPASGNAGLQFYANAPSPVEAMAVALVKVDFLDKLQDWRLASQGSSLAMYR